MPFPPNPAEQEETVWFLAGHAAPAGIYTLVGTGREVQLEWTDVLPATCDGHVAVYERRPLTWAEQRKKEPS